MRITPVVWAILALTLISALYSYWMTWGGDKGLRHFAYPWALPAYLSCGAVFGFLMLWALSVDVRERPLHSSLIVGLSAGTYPLAVGAGPVAAMDVIDALEQIIWRDGTWRQAIDPEIVSVALIGAFASVALSASIALVLRKPWLIKGHLFWATCTGLVGGGLIGYAVGHGHGRLMGDGSFYAPAQALIPGYIIWQLGLMVSLLLSGRRAFP